MENERPDTTIERVDHDNGEPAESVALSENNQLKVMKGDGRIRGREEWYWKKALATGYHALRQMRVSTRKSIYSLIRIRVPASGQKDVVKRYKVLSERIVLKMKAVKTAMVTDTTDPKTYLQLVPTAVALLADIYRLEEELTAADEERDRLMANDGRRGGGSGRKGDGSDGEGRDRVSGTVRGCNDFCSLQ